MEHISSQLVQHGACISHSAFCLCHGSPGLIVPEHHYELYWSKQSCHNETCIESSWPKDAHVLDCTDHNNVTNSDVFLPNFVSVVKQRQGQQCKTYTILYGLMYIYKYVRCFTLQNRQKLLGILSARWWFRIFFIFNPIWGWFPIWPIFSKWLGNHQPVRCFSPSVSPWEHRGGQHPFGAWMSVVRGRRGKIGHKWSRNVKDLCLEVDVWLVWEIMMLNEMEGWLVIDYIYNWDDSLMESKNTDIVMQWNRPWN